MSTDTTTAKRRTITLTGRPPVTITDEAWPVIAAAAAKDHDGEYEFRANEKWSDWLKVRQHADGRVLVYGGSTYDTNWRERAGYTYRGGELLGTPVAGGHDNTTGRDYVEATGPRMSEIVGAIERVAADLTARGGRDMTQVAHECIADLPAVEL